MTSSSEVSTCILYHLRQFAPTFDTELNQYTKFDFEMESDLAPALTFIRIRERLHIKIAGYPAKPAH